MDDKPTITYYGVESKEKESWKPCGIIGVVSEATYTDVRAALLPFEHLRVVPIENRQTWGDVFKAGSIVEFTALLTVLRILCIK